MHALFVQYYNEILFSMKNNIRHWLKQSGLVVAGLSLAPLRNFALDSNCFLNKPENDPIRLSSNENPYGPSQLARKAMADTVNISNRYQWTIGTELISGIAELNNINVDNILLGAGSTEILDLVIQFTALKKGSFILADQTFSPWAKTAERLGLQKITVPLTATKDYDLSLMLKAIKEDTKLIHICNPNNPTGSTCNREMLLLFVKEASKKVMVLVDEAYIEYANQKSLSPLINENENLIITKTFSKIYGLAGARVGYALAHPNIIEKLSQLQTWANGGVSAVTLAGAMASLKDHDFVNYAYSSNEKARKFTIDQLENLKIRCIQSYSNFIYFSLANYEKDYFSQLKSNNIIGTRIYEDKGKWSRITVGTMQEMQLFIKAIE